MEKPSEQMIKAIETSKIKSVQEFLIFLSPEAVYNLLKNWGGCTISLPKFDSFLKDERNEKIKEDYYKGATFNQLAKKYALSTRRIHSIINGGSKNG